MDLENVRGGVELATRSSFIETEPRCPTFNHFLFLVIIIPFNFVPRSLSHLLAQLLLSWPTGCLSLKKMLNQRVQELTGGKVSSSGQSSCTNETSSFWSIHKILFAGQTASSSVEKMDPNLAKWCKLSSRKISHSPVLGSSGQLTFSLGLCRLGWIAAHDVIFTKLKGQLYTLRFPKLTLIQSGKGWCTVYVPPVF